MTIKTLFQKVSEEKPNAFTDEKLLGFLNEIEIEVYEQLNIQDEFEPYKMRDLERDESLQLDPPYDRLYVSYLKAMIDYANEEYDSYANNQAQHVQDFRDFVDWTVRTKQMEDWKFPSRFINAM